MTASLSPRMQKVCNIGGLTVSSISLLADIFGLGKLSYDVIVQGDLADLGFKLAVLVIAFLFGVGLGVVSIMGLQNVSLLFLSRFYAWVYLAITCFSYLGISLVLHRQDYTIGTYAAFILVILSELLAVTALHVIIDDHNIRPFAIPVMTVCLIHIVLIVYTYLFVTVPVSIYLAGDLFFFIAMSLVGSAMLGDVGFKTMLSSIWQEVTKESSRQEESVAPKLKMKRLLLEHSKTESRDDPEINS